MPIGGIGTGTLLDGARGSGVCWQIFNKLSEDRGFRIAFFAVRVQPFHRSE